MINNALILLLIFIQLLKSMIFPKVHIYIYIYIELHINIWYALYGNNSELIWYNDVKFGLNVTVSWQLIRYYDNFVE